jgi:hypothetical protein
MKSHPTGRPAASRSPLLNASGQIVGQRSGACGDNADGECDAINHSTVDGVFASDYPQVAPFLGSGSPACSTDADCSDGDPCTTDTCDAGTRRNALASSSLRSGGSPQSGRANRGKRRQAPPARRGDKPLTIPLACSAF